MRKQVREKEDIVIGKNIRQLRNANGESLASLSKAVGVSYQQLQKYESGHTKVYIGYLAKVCNHYGVTFNDVFKLKGAKIGDNKLSLLHMGQFNELEASEKQLVRDFMEGLDKG